MSESGGSGGPFDRILDTATNRDNNARTILIGMGVLGILLLVIVVSPFSIFGGEDNTPGDGGQTTQGTQSPANAKAPKVPEGYEALSRLFSGLKEPTGTNAPYAITLNLLQPVSDGRNIGLYTSKDGKWERVAAATLANNGSAATGQVEDMPTNLAVLRRTTNAAIVLGSLGAGAQPDMGALDVLTTVNPQDYTPGADGSLVGTASQLPVTDSTVMPTVRASSQAEIDIVNTILASPALREAHMNALLQVAQQPGNGGVDIDYQRVNPARRADYTAFVSGLAERLHQANKSLSITLPLPVKSGVSWDTGAYDWEQLAKQADMVKLVGETDPSVYYRRMEEVLSFLKPKVDMRRVVLQITRQSYEKGSDGLRALSLNEGLTIASMIEVRTTQITPNASVIIVGKNIFQDDGASGLRWDDAAFAVSFSYPGRGGQRTVWLENALSVAFKVDLARRYGLGGVAIDDVSLNGQAAAPWEPLRSFAETGTVKLAAANGVLLRPTWQIQAGPSEAGAKGSVVWKAPAQPGAYDVALIVSDGVILAQQKIILEVAAASSSGTPDLADTHAYPHADPSLVMPLRVIGGSVGGLVLKGPPRATVRPTTDRVREAVFEMLGAHDTDMTRVLDLYSGTGAMGIEALSRGAEGCDFVEMDARTCEVIRENLGRTGFLAGGKVRVFNLPVARALNRLEGPYDLVVADPPYEYDRAEAELLALLEKGLLAEGGTLVVEHSKRHDWPTELLGRRRLVSRRYGDSHVTIYR